MSTTTILGALTGVALVGDIACAIAGVNLPGVLDQVVLVGLSALAGASLPRAAARPVDRPAATPEV